MSQGGRGEEGRRTLPRPGISPRQDYMPFPAFPVPLLEVLETATCSDPDVGIKIIP